jgi:hypothetical protein
MRRLVALALLAWAVGMLPGPGAVEAGDVALAEFLLKHGRKSLDKNDLEDAHVKLAKAREENPALIEVTYWIAYAYEKGDQRTRAVEEYRAFVTAAEAKDRGEGLSRDETGLLKKARSRLDSLDAGTQAILKSNDAFARKVLEFAMPLLERKPDVAERALHLLLGLVPEHAEARLALAALKGVPTTADEGVLTGLPDRWDLLKAHALGTSQGWRYDGDELEVDSLGGALVTPSRPIDSGPTYALEMEIEYLADLNPAKTSVQGLAFALRNNEGYMLLCLPDEISLERATRGGFQQVATGKVKPWKPGMVRRIGLRVEGRTVRAYLDGERVLEHTLDKETDLAGEIGLFHERLKVRYKKMLLARPTQEVR